MDLGSVLSKKSVDIPTFVAIKISTTGMLATTWHIENGKVIVGRIGVGEITADTPESMLMAADKAVSEALTEQNETTHKVIFGLTPDWINDGKIIPDKLSFLRQLCKDIDLSPMGFVPVSEAIENYLKEAEGAPLTAVMIGIDKDKGWVTLYRAGKNLGTAPIVPQEDICLGVEQSLKKFSHIDVLPARMIIYDGTKDLEALEAKITAYPWTKTLPFLHFPKVEILSGEMVVRAVAAAGGTQMGGTIEEVAVEASSQKEAEELEEVSASEAGFVSGENLGRLQEFVVNKPTPPKTFQQETKRPNPMLGKFNNLMNNFRNNFRRPKLPSKSVPLIVLAIAGIVLMLALTLYFVPQVKAIVHLSSKSFDHEMEINASGQVVEVTEIGTKKGIASGKKLVGDKARGTVTIANPSDARNFPAGTTLTSASGLKFVLASDVQIASGAGVLAMATTNAAITASDIGDQYNLSAGTLFSIANFTGQAKNDAALAGGNSHQATVVTKLDQDRLVATLSAELAQKAKDDLVARLDLGQKLLPNAVTQNISKKKFSKDIDSEADNVSLDLTMDFKGVVATQADIVKNFEDKYPADIPTGYKIVTNQTNIDIKNTKVDKTGNIVMTVHLVAKYLPEINASDITKNIAGKKQQAAMEYIGKLNGVTSSEFVIKPSFMKSIVSMALPWRQNAIKVEVVSD